MSRLGPAPGPVGGAGGSWNVGDGADGGPTASMAPVPHHCPSVDSDRLRLVVQVVDSTIDGPTEPVAASGAKEQRTG
jgi:hypothetical protein